MCDHRHLQLTLDGDSATLCVHGMLNHAGDTSDSSETSDASGTALLDLCAALPLHVRTLRLDLRALGAMSAEATSVVRSLLAQWRTSRGGEFRLITSHLLATWSPATPSVSLSSATLPATPLPVPTTRSDAMTAAFL